MGNKSGSEFGGIMIRTDKQLYFAGDIVIGNIFLQIVKEGFIGQNVQFNFVGKEVTTWTTGSGDDQTTYFGKNKFHFQTQIFHKFQDQHLPIGQFVFPFQLYLPPFLPGSFHYRSGFIAELTYKVKVAVYQSNTSKRGNIKNKQEIIIREPIKQQIHETYEQNKLQIKTWCCINQGKTSASCQVEKNHYFPGEKLKIKIIIDNFRCRLNIKNLKAVVINQLFCKDNQNATDSSFFEINSTNLRGVEAYQHSQEIICEINLVNRNKPEIQITPSTNGNLIKSLYFVRLLPQYEGCTCCLKEPLICIPITILSIIPLDYLIEPLVQPTNWDPQSFQPIIIPFNNKTNIQMDQMTKQFQ